MIAEDTTDVEFGAARAESGSLFCLEVICCEYVGGKNPVRLVIFILFCPALLLQQLPALGRKPQFVISVAWVGGEVRVGGWKVVAGIEKNNFEWAANGLIA